MMWPRGDNLAVYVDAAHRWLAGQDLYLGSGPGVGFVGPPFQALAFVPMTLFGSWAWLVWDAAHLVAFVVAVVAWRRALRLSWIAAGVASVAVIGPALSDLHQGNLSLMILALLGVSTLALARGHEKRAGFWLGLAVALKVYPAVLLLVWLVHRRWQASAVAVLTAGTVTAIAASPYGVSALVDWVALSGPAGWPLWRFNQSLHAHGLRAGLGPAWLLELLSAALLIGVVWLTRRQGVRRATVVATALLPLLSPISWPHYFALLWPALGALWAGPRGARGVVLAASALLLTTTHMPLTAGDSTLAAVGTVGAFLLVTQQRAAR